MYKYISIFLISFFVLSSCNQSEETAFSNEALHEPLENIDGSSTNLKEVLEKHKGKEVIVEFWASWCADCIKSMPKVAKFQKANPEVQFVLISVDEETSKWKNGLSRYIDRFEIQGEHYHFPSGWDKNGDNALIDFVGLDWIPRYMLVGKDGNIKVYYAKTITDKNIVESL